MKVSNAWKEGGLQQEPVEYGVLVLSPQVTQQVASIGTSLMPLYNNKSLTIMTPSPTGPISHLH